MKTLRLIFGSLILLTSSFNLFAQNDAITLCGNIDIIERKLAKKLTLFTEYESFQQAMVFNNEGNGYMMEIIYKSDDKLFVDRKAMTQSDLDRLCVEIIGTGTKIDAPALDQGGRTEFLISSTLSGLAFYGPATIQTLNIDNSRAQVGTYMLVGSASFFAPFFATKDRHVTKSMARAYSVGTLNGIAHGFAIRELLNVNDPDVLSGAEYQKTRINRDRRLAIPIAMGLAQGVGLMTLAQQRNMELANVTMIGSGSAWGAGLGGALGAMSLSDGLDAPKDENRVLPLAMLGSIGGMYAGHKIFHKMPSMTHGDAMVMNSYGLMGALYAGTLSDLAFDSYSSGEEKATLAGLSLLSAGGLAYGLHRTKNYNYSTGEGSFIRLSQLAGGMLGMGVGYLVSGDDMGSETALVSASLGATAGIFFMDSFLRLRNRNIHTSIGNINLDFNPGGVANAFSKSEKKSLEDFQLDTQRNHIVSARVTF